MVMIGSREVGAFMDEQKEKMLWEVKVQLIRHHWEQQWPPVFYSLNSKCFSSNFSLQPSPQGSSEHQKMLLPSLPHLYFHSLHLNHSSEPICTAQSRLGGIFQRRTKCSKCESDEDMKEGIRWNTTNKEVNSFLLHQLSWRGSGTQTYAYIIYVHTTLSFPD